MSDEPSLDRRLMETYRARRAPPGFPARVGARAAETPRRSAVGWPAMATAVLVLAVAAYLLLPLSLRPPAGTEPPLVIPSSPDYWAEISVPLDLQVPDLSEIGAVPLFPESPAGDASPTPRDEQSLRPAPGRHTLASLPSHTPETIHETVHA